MKQGNVIAGKFVLGEKLAEGGMGSVWRATHAQLGTPVAIKFMAASLADQGPLRVRFEREARASAMLQSPNVVRILDYGFDGAMPYIAMELLVGESLGARLKREGRMPIEKVAHIVNQVARALRKAHEAGIIHRDLKPQNIFLATEDDEEVVKVVDFGIAKVLGNDVGETTTGALLGSPMYMSPEQVRRGRDADHRTDLWALGVVAYRCVTGQPPFAGSEMGDIIVRICTEAPAPPTSIAPELSTMVDAFFETALAKDPGLRFQSAIDFARAFAHVAQVSGPSTGNVGAQVAAAKRTMPFLARQDLRAGDHPARRSATVDAPTPSVHALTATSEEGTLTNASSHTDVRRAAERASRARRGLVGLVVALVAAIVAVLVIPRLRAPPGVVEPSAAAPVAAAPPAAATESAPAPRPSASVVATAEAPAPRPSASVVATAEAPALPSPVASAPAAVTARAAHVTAPHAPPPRHEAPAQPPPPSDKASSVLGF